MSKLALIAGIAALTGVQNLSVNNAGGPKHPRDSNDYYNYTIDEPAPVNLTGKKYKDFDLAEFSIHWNGSREEVFHNAIDPSKRGHLNHAQQEQSRVVQFHQPHNMSAINWGGIPDSLVEKMKEHDVMPKRGIPNRLLTLGPWLPSWHDSYNQKFLPNGTEFLYFDFEAAAGNVSMISAELEKLGIHGAEKGYSLVRPFSFKKDFFQWMALWHYGGIYMDAKEGFARPVADWVDFQNDEFVSCVSPGMTMSADLVAMTPHHPWALLMVKHLVEQVNERAYFDGNHRKRVDPLNVTGPSALRNMFIENHQGTYANFRCHYTFKESVPPFSAINVIADGAQGDNRTVVAVNNPVPGENTWSKMKNCSKCNDYTLLFKNRQIYCDEPGPTLGCGGHNYTYWQDENTWKLMRTMAEEWEGPHTEAKLFPREQVEAERKALHDVFLAHNISVGADPNEQPTWFPEDQW